LKCEVDGEAAEAVVGIVGDGTVPAGQLGVMALE
jgi:hypothetical protein